MSVDKNKTTTKFWNYIFAAVSVVIAVLSIGAALGLHYQSWKHFGISAAIGTAIVSLVACAIFMDKASSDD